MQITLNGRPAEFPGRTVADLVAAANPQPPFAVAVNTRFVPKGRYAETPLAAHDAVDIVRPVAGG